MNDHHTTLLRLARLIAALALVLSFLGLAPTATHAATIDVCPSGCTYTGIQAAIDAAVSGDTITIGAGSYSGRLSIGKNLTLQGAGADKTSINGGGGGSVITVAGDTTAAVSGVTVTGGNNTQYGGGINNAGTLAVSNSAISGNVSGYYGGGINNTGTLTVSNSTISGNRALWGGGIANTGAATISNSTFSGNGSSTNTYYGGGIFGLFNTTLTVSSSTFAGNLAGFGGGGIASLGATTVKNTIVANSASGNCAYPLSDAGGNLSSDDTCFTAGTSQTSVDSRLDPDGLKNNGGTTQTIALLSGSPAIDKGVDCPPPATDQRGMQRPQGKACDVGAFEIEIFNQAPTDISLSPSSVAENQPSGAAVGTFTTNDPDAGDTFTYALVSGDSDADNAKFSIDGAALKTAASFDYESKNSYSIRVRSTDAGGLSVEKVFTITITNVNEAPTIAVAAGGQCLSDTSGRIKLTLNDVDSSNLMLSSSSSNTTLVPVKNVVFGGTGANRTATITAASGKTGTAVVTITVSDDGQMSSSVTVTVQAGGNGNNTLTGSDSADLLFGQNGDDTLVGKGGIDLLCGGNGNDTLTGGAAADSFDGGKGTDRATDYNTSEGDTRTNIP